MTAASTTDAGRSRPGALLSLACLGAFVLLCGLGTWQVERLGRKEALIATRTARLEAPAVPLPPDLADPAAWEFRRVRVSGVFDHGAEQLFGVEAVDGRVGPHLLTPLRLDDGRALLVDRGWVPEDAKDRAVRPATLPPGRVTVEGILRHRADDRRAWMTPDNRPETRRWYWYDLPALGRATGTRPLPLVLEAAGRPGGGLPRAGRTRVELPNNHLGYAITWYGLAATLAGVYVAFGFRRKETST